MAEDPVKVDPKHYTVEFENDKVRVLRIYYPVGEKSAMHGHPNLVAIFLGDGTARFTYPDGDTEDAEVMAEQIMWFPAVEHLPENVGKTPIRGILVEIK